MKASTDPYKECATCVTLTDCPHPDLTDDMMSSPMPPDECPRPIETMQATLKLRQGRVPKRNG